MISALITSDPRYPISKEKIKSQVDRTLSEMKVIGDVEVSISFVGDRKMKELNKAFRGTDATTDVLSFPLEEQATGMGFVLHPDKILRLGDIIISYPQAIANAAEYNQLVDDEINLLIEHSLLHLLGVHHEGD